ncbi:hypothetical protein WJX72_008006 [[Myrmecia] bisecta]|uniref:Myb-like domain-containing protein n=1 Tax=[Myrmecia] bisecta TaxID=41462 RepID=A0AAW1Q7C8_9CHLO
MEATGTDTMKLGVTPSTAAPADPGTQPPAEDHSTVGVQDGPPVRPNGPSHADVAQLDTARAAMRTQPLSLCSGGYAASASVVGGSAPPQQDQPGLHMGADTRARPVMKHLNVTGLATGQVSSHLESLQEKNNAIAADTRQRVQGDIAAGLPGNLQVPATQFAAQAGPLHTQQLQPHQGGGHHPAIQGLGLRPPTSTRWRPALAISLICQAGKALLMQEGSRGDAPAALWEWRDVQVKWSAAEEEELDRLVTLLPHGKWGRDWKRIFAEGRAVWHPKRTKKDLMNKYEQMMKKQKQPCRTTRSAAPRKRRRAEDVGDDEFQPPTWEMHERLHDDGASTPNPYVTAVRVAKPRAANKRKPVPQRGSVEQEEAALPSGGDACVADPLQGAYPYDSDTLPGWSATYRPDSGQWRAKYWLDGKSSKHKETNGLYESQEMASFKAVQALEHMLWLRAHPGDQMGAASWGGDDTSMEGLGECGEAATLDAGPSSKATARTAEHSPTAELGTAAPGGLAALATESAALQARRCISNAELAQDGPAKDQAGTASEAKTAAHTASSHVPEDEEDDAPVVLPLPGALSLKSF